MQRRMFLKGAGGVIFGLPFLESLMQNGTANAQAAPAPFAIFVHQGMGVEPKRWWPNDFGKLDANSFKGKGIAPLAPYADKLLILGRLFHGNVRHAGQGDHGEGGAMALTGAPVDGNNDGSMRALGPSLDYVLSKALMGGQEPLGLMAGRSNSGVYECLSYRKAKDRIAPEANPYQAYRTLFGMGTTPGAPNDPAKDAKALLRKSVNDRVREEMLTLLSNPKLSKVDKDRLVLHQSSIRDLEKAIVTDLKMPDDRKKLIDAYQSKNAVVSDKFNIGRLHCDILALAAATGQMRAGTLHIGPGQEEELYNSDGSLKGGGYHNITHMRDQGSQDIVHQLDIVNQQVFAHLLNALNQYKFESNGKTLLDYGVTTFFNSLGWGADHARSNLPHIIAGSGNGQLKQGQYVSTNVPTNKFLSSIGKVMGVAAAADFNAQNDAQKGVIDSIFV